MKAGMGPPYGLFETSKKGWNASSSGERGVTEKNVQRKIGQVVKNVQKRLRQVIRRVVGNVQMRAGMGPPDGSLKTSKKGWNGSWSGERGVFGNVLWKRSKKAETTIRNGLTETCKEGWNGSSEWVVKNVRRQELLERAIDNIQQRLGRGFVGTGFLNISRYSPAI
jgi:hypothetical protein